MTKGQVAGSNLPQNESMFALGLWKFTFLRLPLHGAFLPKTHSSTYSEAKDAEHAERQAEGNSLDIACSLSLDVISCSCFFSPTPFGKIIPIDCCKICWKVLNHQLVSDFHILYRSLAFLSTQM